ncbi:hypothetical protein ACFXO7_38940, partial [Nocardia tengchongensis]
MGEAQGSDVGVVDEGAGGAQAQGCELSGEERVVVSAGGEDQPVAGVAGGGVGGCAEVGLGGSVVEGSEDFGGDRGVVAEDPAGFGGGEVDQFLVLAGDRGEGGCPDVVAVRGEFGELLGAGGGFDEGAQGAAAAVGVVHGGGLSVWCPVGGFRGLAVGGAARGRPPGVGVVGATPARPRGVGLGARGWG